MISSSSGEIEKSLNPVLVSRSSPRHDHNDRQIPANSRQAAIEALHQMPEVTRIKAGVALPHDSSVENLVFLDSGNFTGKTENDGPPDEQ